MIHFFYAIVALTINPIALW